jgi:hypothetical protein
VRILVHRKKTGDTYGSIDSYGDSPSDVKTYVKENKLHGRRLLKESINAIVRGYDENSENKHTAQHTADFLEILIVRRGGNDPRNYSRRRTGRDTPYPADLTLTHELNRTNTLRFKDIEK